jgi:hypothetical protein
MNNLQLRDLLSLMKEISFERKTERSMSLVVIHECLRNVV